MSESTSETFIKQLDKSVTNVLCSGQLIASVSSVVKELVENSLDAEASRIQISLLSFGLEKITVKDDGSGVKISDAPYMARRHCTSKLVDYDDLSRLTTYGFRGEGLASICTVADVTIETKRTDETVGRAYTLNHEGNIVTEKPCASNEGTTVTVQNLFKNLPVRKQFYNTSVKKEEELRSIRTILKALAIINTRTRFVLFHNRTPIWTKQQFPDVTKSLEEVIGFKLMQQLVPIEHKTGNNTEIQLEIMAFLPKKNCDHRLIGKQQPDSTYLFVNRRPVKQKDVFKLLKAFYSTANGLTGSLARYPTCCVILDVAASSVDVNIDPDKSSIYLHHKERILEELKSVLEKHYEVTEQINLLDNSLESTPKAMKIDSRVDESRRSSNSEISLNSYETGTPTWSSSSFSSSDTLNHSANPIFKAESESRSITSQTDDEPVCIHVPFQSRETVETDFATSTVEHPPAKKQKKLDEIMVKKLKAASAPFDKTATVKNGTSCSKKLRECATRVLMNCKQRLVENQLPLDGFFPSQSKLQDKTKVVAFDIETLRQKLSNCKLLHQRKQTDSKCWLIGRLDNGFWICKMNDELHVINHHRIHEKVLLDNLMQTHKVVTRPLGTPITITETTLGILEFNTLTSLSYEYTPQDSIVSITDERILSNGFNIRKIKFDTSSQSISTLQLIGLADHLPFFGVEDLKEVLHKIAVESSVSLYDCRTSVIVQHLKAETVRMVRNCPYRLDKREIVDLLRSMRKCKSEEEKRECNQCFHGKPFFTKICDIM